MRPLQIQCSGDPIEQFGVRHGKHEENFELNVYGGVRTGTLADVGTIGLTDGIQGFGDDQSHHIQVGRDNVLAWVKGSPVNTVT